MPYPLFITFTTGTKIRTGRITIVAHLLIPKFIILNLAHSFTFLSIFYNLVLDDAHRTISSTKSPPQHLDSPKGIPSSEKSLKMSLINRLKRIGDSGQPCLTPFIKLKDSRILISNIYICNHYSKNY